MADEFSQTLDYIALQLNRYVPIGELLFGTFGNLMNIIIFMRPSLRSNPCSCYFWISSINNLFYLYAGLFTRMLASGWDIDPTQYSNLLCKLRIYFVYTSSCLVQWYMVVASIDRYFSSCMSARIRQWSSVQMARKIILFTTVIVIVAHFHTLVWFSVEFIDETTTICNVFNHNYDVFFSVFDILFSCLLPPLLMIIFGLKTVSNFRQLRRIVMPSDQKNARQIRLRNKDRQMIVMLLIQVAATILTSAPFTAINVYSTANANLELTPMSPIATAIYNFAANIFRLINYLAPILGFYIYTLSGSVFRHEMRHILRRAFSKVCIKTKIDRCLPEHLRRKLYQHEETAFTQQSISLTRMNRTAGTNNMSIVA